MKMRIVMALVCLALGVRVFAVTPHQLFIIERSTNANIVVYEARLDGKGDFAADAPVVAYWKLNATTGGTEPLSFLEKKGFGFDLVKDGGQYRMILTPLKDRPILVVKHQQTVRAQMVIAGVPSWLSRVYVRSGQGVILPTVEYVELFGAAVAGGGKTYEKMVP